MTGNRRSPRLVAALAVAMVAGCTSGGPPPGPDPSPSPAPWSNEVRYDPDIVGSGLCDLVDWDYLGDEELDATLSLTSVAENRIEGGWVAECGFDSPGVPGEPVWPWGTLTVVAADDPATSYSHYIRWKDDTGELDDHIVEKIDGWWEEGIYVESIREGGRYDSRITAVLHYLLRDENLSLWLRWSGKLEDGGPLGDRDDLVPPLDELARGLIDEVAGHIPCEPLVDPPPATLCSAP